MNSQPRCRPHRPWCKNIPSSPAKSVGSLAFESSATPGQFGGPARRSPEMAQHLSRTLWSRARSRGRCCFSIYFDVTVAFCSLVRELVYEPSQQKLSRTIAESRLPKQLKHLLEERLEEHVRCGASEHVTALVHAAHTDSWITTEGSRSMTRARSPQGHNSWTQPRRYPLQLRHDRRVGKSARPHSVKLAWCGQSRGLRERHPLKREELRPSTWRLQASSMSTTSTW